MHFMAQIENVSRHRSGLHIIRKAMYIDLTPMVDLGFLLITFFMLSTTLSEANAADLIMPKDSTMHTDIKRSAVLTLMPVRNNKIDYFEGENSSPANMKHCSYGQLRSIIMEKKNKVARVLGDRNETVIIIDPGAESTYKNFVDILDEIEINDIRHYFVLNHQP